MLNVSFVSLAEGATATSNLFSSLADYNRVKVPAPFHAVQRNSGRRMNGLTRLRGCRYKSQPSVSLLTVNATFCPPFVWNLEIHSLTSSLYIPSTDTNFDQNLIFVA